MRASLALLLASLAGCGSFGSGTWDDDPRNWSRAFESAMPDTAVVKHSRYTRFAHLTHEFEYFFQLAPNAELSRQILRDGTLVRLRPADAGWSRTGDTPEWFAPKAEQAYDVYARAGDSQREFRVLVDRRTRELFFTDRRL